MTIKQIHLAFLGVDLVGKNTGLKIFHPEKYSNHHRLPFNPPVLESDAQAQKILDIYNTGAIGPEMARTLTKHVRFGISGEYGEGTGVEYVDIYCKYGNSEIIAKVELRDLNSKHILEYIFRFMDYDVSECLIDNIKIQENTNYIIELEKFYIEFDKHLSKNIDESEAPSVTKLFRSIQIMRKEIFNVHKLQPVISKEV